MLVHDIKKNESQVVDFRETAPFNIQEEGLNKFWETKVGHYFYYLTDEEELLGKGLHSSLVISSPPTH